MQPFWRGQFNSQFNSLRAHVCGRAETESRLAWGGPRWHMRALEQAHLFANTEQLYYPHSQKCAPAAIAARQHALSRLPLTVSEGAAQRRRRLCTSSKYHGFTASRCPRRGCTGPAACRGKASLTGSTHTHTGMPTSSHTTRLSSQRSSGTLTLSPALTAPFPLARFRQALPSA